MNQSKIQKPPDEKMGTQPKKKLLILFHDKRQSREMGALEIAAV